MSSLFSKLGAEIWRDHVTAGVPGSGPWDVVKPDMRAWMRAVEATAIATSVWSYGAIGDGTAHYLSEYFSSLGMAQVIYPLATSLTQTIDWAAIVHAEAAAHAAGGGRVRLGTGKFVINSTIFRKEKVFLEGDGAVYSDETTSALTLARANSATQIVWDTATAGSVMIAFMPSGVDDDTATVPRGGGMRDVLVDGKNVATCCIQIISWVGLEFYNVHAIHAVTLGWNMGTYAAGATVSKYTSGFHSFYNITYLDGGNGSDALAMWGASGLYNTCLCQFFGGVMRGNRISIGDADSNYFYGFKWGATLRLEAQGTSPYSIGNYFSGRNNVFFGTSGLVIAKAQTAVLQVEAPHSCNNMLIGHTNDAGGPLPTIEAGADLTVWATSPVYLDRKGGAMYGNASMGTKVQLAATQAIANETTTVITWPNPSNHNPLAIWAAGNPTRLTVPNNIKFARVTLVGDFAANVNGARYVDILKNGADIMARGTTWAMDNSLPTSVSADTGWVAVTPGDYFEGRGNHDAGASLNLAAFTTHMTMDVK